MAYTFHTLLAKNISYGGVRSASDIRYIVLHYTANETDTARANATYFSASGSNTRSAGAHYFVDDTTVYQSIPDTRTAWSVGGNKYSDTATTGGGTMYGKITNGNSISVELCSKGSKITDVTIANAVQLVKTLMKKYNIPVSRVCRHFDVTGKQCPGWPGWTGKNAPNWDAFKAKLTIDTDTEGTDMTETEVRALMETVVRETAKKAVSNYAAEAWEAAKKAGVLDGSAPQGSLTREQLATVLRQLGLIGGGNTPSAWAADAFQAATAAGVLDGSNPHGYVTREMLALVLNSMGLIGNIQTRGEKTITASDKEQV